MGLPYNGRRIGCGSLFVFAMIDLSKFQDKQDGYPVGKLLTIYAMPSEEYDGDIGQMFRVTHPAGLKDGFDSTTKARRTEYVQPCKPIDPLWFGRHGIGPEWDQGSVGIGLHCLRPSTAEEIDWAIDAGFLSEEDRI